MKFSFAIRAMAIVAVWVLAPGFPSAQNAPPSAAPPAGSASPAPTATPSPAASAPSPAPTVVQTTPVSSGGKSANTNNNDDRWTAKDVATILAGLGGLCGAAVAAFAIRSNGQSSRATTIQKANEAELESLQSKLDGFYGPYLQLSSTNALIATDLKSRQREGAAMRVLLVLLDPDWRQNFTQGDVSLIEEILAIDGELLDLIQKESGLVSSAVQPYLWRAASHFRIMKLAADKKLDNDPSRYAHYVYPKQLDKVLDLEIGRIRDRIELIRSQPMVLHPPAPELAIPAELKLDAWSAAPAAKA